MQGLARGQSLKHRLSSIKLDASFRPSNVRAVCTIWSGQTRSAAGTTVRFSETTKKKRANRSRPALQIIPLLLFMGIALMPRLITLLLLAARSTPLLVLLFFFLLPRWILPRRNREA